MSNARGRSDPVAAETGERPHFPDGIGAVIWEEVARNSTYGSLVGLLCARYTGARAEIERAAARFLKELEDECLIVPCDSAADAVHQVARCDAPGPAASSDFRAPVLRKYTDMQALLLLDPIHEVDEQGWPIRKDPAAE
jgi:hypothetical protein